MTIKPGSSYHFGSVFLRKIQESEYNILYKGYGVGEKTCGFWVARLRLPTSEEDKTFIVVSTLAMGP